MKAILAALLLLAPWVSSANDITVGEVGLGIPNPAGFVPITPQMKTLYEFEKQVVAASNEEFIAFIPEAGATAALRGELPSLTRKFAVQTTKPLVAGSMSSADFAQLKTVVKSQNEEIIKSLEKKMPGLAEQLNQGISKKYNVDLAFSVSQMVPMPVHDETDRTLGYSALVRFNMNDAAGQPAQHVVVVTATFVFVKSKILFLYCYAEEEGLQWSREASKQWANAVVAANPPDLKSTVKESLPPAARGFDWSELGRNAVIGAAIGLAIGLIAWLKNRGKAK